MPNAAQEDTSNFKAARTDSLNQLSTNWGEIVAAQGTGPAARQAQCAVLRRYGRAVKAYLENATGDAHSADDLAQEFALKFVRRSFHQLHPTRGRFRDFVRAVLHNLVADYYRAQKSAPKALPQDSAVAVAANAPSVDDDAFAGYWRTELLNRAWEELKHLQTRTRAPLYAALRLRVEHPERSAAELGQLLDRPVVPETYRQLLRRARIKFAELLWLEVAFSLGTNQRGEVEQELADLQLLAYCGPLRKSQ